MRRCMAAFGLAAALTGCGRPSAKSTEPPPGAFVPSNHARSLEDGEALYESMHTAEAAWVFQEVLFHRLPGDGQRAEFFFGKSLFQLGRYEESLAVFRRVASNDQHPFYGLAAPWLLSIAKQGPPLTREALELVALYPEHVFFDEAYDGVRDELWFRVGQYRVRTGELAAGMALLEQVPEPSDYWTAAQFELGEFALQRRELVRARNYFQGIVARDAKEHPNARSRRRGHWDPVVPLAMERLRQMGVRTPEPPTRPKCRRGEWQQRCAADPHGVFW